MIEPTDRPELTIDWIIALWLAIHGGDPAPIEVSNIARLLGVVTLADGLGSEGRQIRQIAAKQIAEHARQLVEA